jgi:hypothetical protein
VRAERIACLRIGIAACMLLDILLSYLPNLELLFSAGGLGDPEIHDHYFRSPYLTWSVLRGLGDPMLRFVALAFWGTLTIYFLCVAVTWWKQSDEAPTSALNAWLAVWTACAVLVGVGSWWSEWRTEESSLMWVVPATLLAVHALCFLVAASGFLWRERRRDVGHLLAQLAGLVVLGATVGLGCWLHFSGARPAWLASLLDSWQRDQGMMQAAIWLWVAATVLLLLGLWTRVAVVAAWALSLSFAHVNPQVDNAGDVARYILLFYLLWIPSGAVWSVDHWRWRKRNGGIDPPTFVSPWSIRMVFLQMIAMYFLNGLAKTTGESWQEGTSLYYALCDITLARISFEQVPLPYWLTRSLTFAVLAWELAFPLLVCFRVTRILALVFGVLFHLGIGMSMVLGFFVPYVLVYYLPFLPWDRWLRAPAESSEAGTAA